MGSKLANDGTRERERERKRKRENDQGLLDLGYRGDLARSPQGRPETRGIFKLISTMIPLAEVETRPIEYYSNPSVRKLYNFIILYAVRALDHRLSTLNSLKIHKLLNNFNNLNIKFKTHHNARHTSFLLLVEFLRGRAHII